MYQYFLLNIEFINKQKQCLIVKGIIEIVPNCKGNYKNGPKVYVFSFPKDKELSDVSTRTIKRENFSPTKFSRVGLFVVFCLFVCFLY